MGWKVVISPSAQADLAEIVRYVARHNQDAAARLGYELITRAEGIGAFPEMGRIVPEFREPHLREVVCRSYRVIYRLRPAEQSVDIVRFWHAAPGLSAYPRWRLIWLSHLRSPSLATSSTARAGRR